MSSIEWRDYYTLSGLTNVKNHNTARGQQGPKVANPFHGKSIDDACHLIKRYTFS